MGIARLTQDFRPYLEHATIGAQTSEAEIRFQDVVIDGPSMVYHVYGKIFSFKRSLNSNGDWSILTPTYSEISHAAACFLVDLERSGAKIVNIFFDGALPQSKTPVRVERLERSRVQLESLRLSHPPRSLLSENRHLLRDGVLYQALWSTRSTITSGSTILTPPFMVPAVIEYLNTSKWRSCTHVVPGEAETFCAQTAAETRAAVLTNDSDLLLFQKMIGGGMVARLDSLSMTIEGKRRIISAQVWRPGRIAKALDLPDLTLFAYERSRDATTSTAVIAQRAKLLLAAQEMETEIETFLRQYTGPAVEIGPELQLDQLDPRLAELACQMHALRSSASARVLQMTLPILYEDPRRDSSWSYGRVLRSVSYGLMSMAYSDDERASSDVSLAGKSSKAVSELQRKGQRVTEEYNPIALVGGHHDQPRTVLKCLRDLSEILSLQDPNDFRVSHQAYLRLWAIRVVLDQRNAREKTTSKSLIQQYLGIGLRTIVASDESGLWELVHLHANVDAVLYSLRMVLQAFSFSQRIQSYQASSRTNNATPMQEVQETLIELSCKVDISSSFLSIEQVRQLMQAVPEHHTSPLIDSVEQEISKQPPIATATAPIEETDNDGFQTLSSKVYRNARTPVGTQSNQISHASATGFKPNMYALLAEDGS